MDWSNLLTLSLGFVGGNLSAGVIFNELLKHRLEGSRARTDRQAQLQLNLLLALQGALEQVNQGRAQWGAAKLATAEVMKKWPQQLPPPDLESIAEQGDAAIRAILPVIRDDKVKVLAKEFQEHAREAFHGNNRRETRPKVEAARRVHELTNQRIGEVIQSL